MARHDALIVQPQQLDHVADVVGILDAPRRGALAIGEHGAVPHLALGEELGPYLLGEEQVRGVIAVEVADLPPADREGELAAVLLRGRR